MDFKESAKSGQKSFLERCKANGVKIVVVAALLSTVTFNLGFAKEDQKEKFDKIYHIYNGDAYIGAVSNKETIDALITQKKQEASTRYEELSIDAGSNITIMPEQVFTANVNEAETIEKLVNSIAIEADAYALLVNGERVAYLKDASEYEQAMNLLKLQYISQQELDALNNHNVTEPVALTEDNQTRVVELSLVEDVTGEAAKVNPADIITPEQAVELLQSGALEKEVYEVQQGDVLGSIAKKHGLKLKELLALNPEVSETELLKIGQPLNVTVAKPFVTVKVVMEKFKVEAIEFQKIKEEDSTMPKGESKVKQEGKAGQKEVLYTITSENGVRTDKQVTNEVVVAEPVNTIEVIGTKVIPSRGTGSFAWPTVGGYISSHMGERWGAYHRGIDIARPSNYTIKATDNGVVTFTGWDGTYGNKIVINHNNGYETVYAHLSSIDVSVGQVVEQGSKIGVMGSTGNSTGTHLHFEVQQNGALINPLSVLK
ncbi:M23 family metallopeptidase [Lysinibacillus sp. KU-BSD001]|uniref:peptidoglycan DD-metalloendopeptidase family protein n=1 Tax=Lysinibacillus sp. KU-BSD001 TaxID=3141328 RepID=UPI0036E7666E